MSVPAHASSPTTLRVPFVDLSPTSSAVKARIMERIGETIDRGDFVNGAAVDEFEAQFADHAGCSHCIGVSSGLDALRLALIASDLSPGAGVMVPAATFAASVEAILQAGGTPVFADVGEQDFTLSADAIARRRRDASHVLPVHLYGQMCNMQAIAREADEHGYTVVEDACQAHGARRDGLAPGRAARAAAFSFYPAKNLGGFGDAGAIVTDDPQLAERARALREHGETRKYHHEHVGYTARLDTIQAIALTEKLRFLDAWNAERRVAAHFYLDALAEVEELRLPIEPEGSESAWHLFVVRTTEPGLLAAFLAQRGIQTGRHYPEPVHLAPAYRHLGHAPGDFPVAEALSREALSLPLYPGITEEQLDWVCRSIAAYVRTA